MRAQPAATSPRRTSLLRTAVCAVPFLLQIILAAGLIVWIIGRVLTDRFGWSQWLWWTPTFIALAISLAGTLLALIPAPPRFGRRLRRWLWPIAALAISIYFCTIEHRIFSRANPEPGGIELVHWTCTMSAPHLRREHAAWAQTFTGDIAILMHSAGMSFDPAMNDVRAHGYDVYPIGLATIITRAPLLEHRPIVVNRPYIVWMMKFDVSRLDTTMRTPDADTTLTIWLVDLPSNPQLSRHDVSQRLRELIDSSTEEPPAVILGDFNIQRGSASLVQVFPDHVHAFAQAGHGYGATFPRERPIYHIDHVLLRAPWRALRYDIEDPGQGRHRRQRVFLTSSPDA
ncbi:MAG: hypothetical protein KC983_04325 [Phycisphaerales bacterium]|nr:hypothetical protein [Phycisphaerales bacterium]